MKKARPYTLDASTSKTRKLNMSHSFWQILKIYIVDVQFALVKVQPLGWTILMSHSRSYYVLARWRPPRLNIGNMARRDAKLDNVALDHDMNMKTCLLARNKRAPHEHKHDCKSCNLNCRNFKYGCPGNWTPFCINLDAILTYMLFLSSLWILNIYQYSLVALGDANVHVDVIVL